MAALTLGLVTRGRPSLLRETLDETVRNITCPDTTIIVCADLDDESMRGFIYDSPHVLMSFAPREDTIGAKWNRMLAIRKSDAYGSMVDHSPIRTQGFDAAILEALSVFPDGIGAVCDHMSCVAFPHMNVASRKWVEAVGYFYPEHFPYWFVDHWFDDLQRMVGRYVLADVVVDSGKRPGTQEQREPALWASLYDGLYREREAAASRLLDAMNEPEWRKDMLRRNFPLVHERSRYINQMVRQSSGTCKTTDERYLRIRDKASAKLLSIYKELSCPLSI